MEHKKFDTIEDLLASDSFMAWYHRTDIEDIRIWNKWITASPENQQLAGEAVRFLKSISIHEKTIAEEQIDTAINDIIQHIHNDPYPEHHTTNHPAMFKNYLTVAVRNLWKNKTFSGINLLGLALGLACSLLILLWVKDEKNMDAFHANKERIYTIYERQYYDGKVVAAYHTPGLLAAELKRVIPEIEKATGFNYEDTYTFSVGDKIMKQNGNFADADFFSMFSYPLLHGNAQTALQSPVSIAISRKMAHDFFGSPEAAMGKTIRYNNSTDFTVTAVFENVPTSSSEKFDFLINWKALIEQEQWLKDWDNNSPRSIIMLRPDADPAKVEAKITHFLDKLNPEQSTSFRVELGMQRYDQMYLHSNFTEGRIEGGRIEYVRLFSIVAIFILLIACINFMNLTTARSIKRAREIGVRKVVGAARPALIGQFIGEAVLLTFIALSMSLLLVSLLLPVFNNVTTKSLQMPFGSWIFWLNLVGLGLVTGCIAGSYPALFLSSFKPASVLKGVAKISTGASWFRRGLVVFQFSLSILLIIGTIVVSQQVQYIQNKNLGYDRQHFVYVPMEGDMPKQYPLFKERALRLPGVQNITRATISPTKIDNGTHSVLWDGKDPNIKPMFAQVAVGYDFVKTMKLKLAAGRDFSKDFATDSTGYIINESALKKIGYKDPIGKNLTFWGEKGTIIGVLKDFHFNSLHVPIRPLILRLNEEEYWGAALVRIEPGRTEAVLDGLQKLYTDMNPAFPFTFQFSDEEYTKLYRSEAVIQTLSRYFAFLGIFISCLGLLGLAIFTAEQKTKEFGIRKVLGAPVLSLFTLLSKDFVILVGIAFVVASPLAWWALNNWLQHFQYRISIGVWVFVAAGLMALLIALLTVSFQAIRSAFASPVKALRSE
jgi:ABC-type antimicrobial peptide transport system, permease component